MLFKDLKPNDKAYILDKSTVEIYPCKIINVAPPRYETIDPQSPSANYPISRSTNFGKVVDVTIECQGRSQTYVIPENSQLTYAGDLVLSTERNSLSAEVESIKNLAKRNIDGYENEKVRYKKSTELLSDLNPVYKEKLEQDKRLSSLESDMGEIKKLLMNIQKSLE